LARNVLGADVAPDAPLMAAGLDSLGAVELRNAVVVQPIAPAPWSAQSPLQ